MKSQVMYKISSMASALADSAGMLDFSAGVMVAKDNTTPSPFLFLCFSKLFLESDSLRSMHTPCMVRLKVPPWFCFLTLSSGVLLCSAQVPFHPSPGLTPSAVAALKNGRLGGLQGCPQPRPSWI